MFSLKRQDQFNLWILQSIAAAVVALMIALVLSLFIQAWPTIQRFGLSFISSDFWNPLDERFGGLAFIYGTLMTSLVALLLAAPVSVMVALFLNEVLPKKTGQILTVFVELIAAVPSIVFGLWGIFYLAPWIRDHLAPVLKGLFGFSAFFPAEGASFGIGLLNASLILAIMITPTITGLSGQVFRSVPKLQKEAALALGATRFECMRIALLRPCFPGIMGAIALGLGRALGETMAVAMVIGNNPQIKLSLFESGATMASVIANEYAEAEGDSHLSALCLVGLLLFAVTLTVNSLARLIIWKHRKRQGGFS